MTPITTLLRLATKKKPSTSPTDAAGAAPSEIQQTLLSVPTLSVIGLIALVIGAWIFKQNKRGRSAREIQAAIGKIFSQIAADETRIRGVRLPVFVGGLSAVFLAMGVLFPVTLPVAVAVPALLTGYAASKASQFIAARDLVVADLFAVGKEHLSWPRNVPDEQMEEYVLVTEWEGLIPLQATVRIGARDATRSDNKKAIFSSEFAAAAGGNLKWTFEWAPKDDMGKAMMVAVGAAEEDISPQQRMHVDQIFSYCRESADRLNWPADATVEAADLYIRVSRWSSNDEPLEVVIRVSPKDAGRSVNDKARFAAGFTAAMRSNRQWVFQWDTQRNIAHGRAIKPLSPARRAQVTKMFEIANASLSWPTGTTPECADSYIRVLKWQGDDPVEIEIQMGAKDVSKSDEARATFERIFSDGMSEDRRWLFEWFPAEMKLRGAPTPPLPRIANLPTHDKHAWHDFPVGVGAGSAEICWDVSQYPHSLIVGTTGSGKSVVQRAILAHALKRPDEWEVVLIDPKRVELEGYRVFAMSEGKGGVVAIATELPEQVELLERAKDIMDQRYRQMRDAGVNHANDYIDPKTGKSPRALLIMVDEAFQLLAPEQGSSEQIKENNELHGRAGIAMGSIARLGRAAKVHMVVATQRPDAKVLSGELKANLDCRIGMGRMDSIPSLMAFDSDAGTFTSPVKGRAKLRQGGLPQEFQGYWLAPTDTYSHIREGMVMHGADLSSLFPSSYQGQPGNEEFSLADRDELISAFEERAAAAAGETKPAAPIEVVPNPFAAAFESNSWWREDEAGGRVRRGPRATENVEDVKPVGGRVSKMNRRAGGIFKTIHRGMYGD